MALVKPIEQPSGATAAYWRVIDLHIDWPRQTLLARVGGYISEAARREGKAPLATRQIMYRGPAFPLTADGNTTAQTYAALKADPFFTGATDV